MIRHILFWKYTDNIKAEHKEEWALHFLQDSVATMDGKVDGLLKIDRSAADFHIAPFQSYKKYNQIKEYTIHDYQ